MPRLLALLLAALLALATLHPASAQDTQSSAAIESVIAGQLDAFNARDVTRAFDYASPMIQGMFGNPANFGLMVENGYPMVWTNDGAQFLDLRDIDGRLWQQVLVTDAQGVRHLLDYTMIQTEDGWKINGVVLIPQPDVGV
jgi:hypothetical protein